MHYSARVKTLYQLRSRHGGSCWDGFYGLDFWFLGFINRNVSPPPRCAGGLGLAAVQLGSAAGGAVSGTAGGPPKRAFLRGLGVRCAASSRDTRFASELAEAGAAPLDVVLNSLTSPGEVLRYWALPFLDCDSDAAGEA